MKELVVLRLAVTTIIAVAGCVSNAVSVSRKTGFI